MYQFFSKSFFLLSNYITFKNVLFPQISFFKRTLLKVQTRSISKTLEEFEIRRWIDGHWQEFRQIWACGVNFGASTFLKIYKMRVRELLEEPLISFLLFFFWKMLFSIYRIQLYPHQQVSLPTSYRGPQVIGSTLGQYNTRT